MIQYFPIVTGSLTVLGNINVSGSITTSGSITISGSITSASFASTASFVANAESASFASTASFVALAQSASNAVSAVTASFANNLTVAGTLTAQTLVVQTITSSVDFVTGSTKFGSSLSTSTHVFSGSVSMNPGGLFVSGSGLVGIGTTSPVARLNVFGTSGNPSMTADTNNLFSITGNLGPQLNIGGYNGASYGMWLQVKDANNTNINYPILLQPLGGAVGIGTTSPLNVLDVRQASATMGNYQTIQAFSTDSAAINLGGGISLGGYYTSTTSIAQFASIVGRKENGTSGNYDGYLAFGTNAQATGVVERMRITSAGNIILGTTEAFNNERLRVAGTITSTTPAIAITSAVETPSVSSGTTTTVWTCPDYPRVMYFMVFTRVNSGANVDYSAYAVVASSNIAGAKFLTNVGSAYLNLSISGRDIRVTQTSGATIGIHTSVIQIFSNAGTI